MTLERVVEIRLRINNEVSFARDAKSTHHTKVTLGLESWLRNQNGVPAFLVVVCRLKHCRGLATVHGAVAKEEPGHLLGFRSVKR